MLMRADNRQYLIAAAARRRAECTARVHAVLDDLEHGPGRVNVAAVAAAADVSRTFLYDPAQIALLTRLRTIAAVKPSTGRAPIPAVQRISTASHEQMMRALRDRNHRLLRENKQLREELAVALGQLRDLRRGAFTAPGRDSAGSS
ncbi:hypothetical protein AB0M36_18365 [Actinoplanes sp. NPDC051346]|uniref:hypothetical protein n=1 Tax=Actinoplanes sp. NPDC051346 TaxID=3155048 RepID=UPI003421D353